MHGLEGGGCVWSFLHARAHIGTFIHGRVHNRARIARGRGVRSYRFPAVRVGLLQLAGRVGELRVGTLARRLKLKLINHGIAQFLSLRSGLALAVPICPVPMLLNLDPSAFCQLAH